MNFRIFAGAMLSGLLATNHAAADAGCVNAADAMPLRVAELQQNLMVAALTCHDERQYNRFVLAYRPELQRSDRAMLKLLEKRDGSRGFAEYNAFKTKLANVSALASNRDSDAFCGHAESVFDATRARTTLSNLALDEPVYAAMPVEACGAAEPGAGYAAADPANADTRRGLQGDKSNSDRYASSRDVRGTRAEAASDRPDDADAQAGRDDRGWYAFERRIQRDGWYGGGEDDADSDSPDDGPDSDGPDDDGM